MADAKFHNKNSVTCEANHVKCKTLMQHSWVHKKLTIVEIGQRFALRGDSLPKSGNFPLLGPRSPTRGPIGVKLRRSKRTHVHLGFAKLHIIQCNESLLWGENADFRPLSKFNTVS